MERSGEPVAREATRSAVRFRDDSARPLNSEKKVPVEEEEEEEEGTVVVVVLVVVVVVVPLLVRSSFFCLRASSLA